MKSTLNAALHSQVNFTLNAALHSQKKIMKFTLNAGEELEPKLGSISFDRFGSFSIQKGVKCWREEERDQDP